MDTEGYVKVLSDASTGQIVGAQIIGPNAGEMIAEAVLAMGAKLTADSVANTCHAHPVRRSFLIIDRPCRKPSRRRACRVPPRFNVPCTCDASLDDAQGALEFSVEFINAND